MNQFQHQKRKNPEKLIQIAIENRLKIEGWYVMRTHGNMYQSGFPDIFACHSTYGQRWIEVKLPEMKGSKFTGAQLECFPKICANGSGVWVLTGDTDLEFLKLKRPPNWTFFTTVMK